MKQKLRIIPSAVNLRDAKNMRFLRFGDELVIYPAMGHMTVKEVINVLGEIADTRPNNGHKRYALINTVQAVGCENNFVNQAITAAYASMHVQKYQKFANVSIDSSKDIIQCGVVIKAGNGKHGEVINKFRQQLNLPPVR